MLIVVDAELARPLVADSAYPAPRQHQTPPLIHQWLQRQHTRRRARRTPHWLHGRPKLLVDNVDDSRSLNDSSQIPGVQQR